MRYKAAIFDFDGTLLDTLDDLADSMNAVLTELGLPAHPVDSYRYFVGQGMTNLARLATPADTAPEVREKIVAMIGKTYGDSWAVKTAPYAGIPGLLADLRRRGLKIGLLSNKPDQFTQVMAAHFFPAGTFDAVSGAKKDVPIKPDPTSALAMARELGVAPADILYFGDTDVDMKTGLSAGMFTIGVTWGFRPVAELTGAGANAIIDTPAEALRFLSEPGQ